MEPTQEWQLMTDIEYLRCAYRVAANLSNDPLTQNGAVLVDFGLSGGSIVAHAANRMPDGLIAHPDRFERPAKHQFIEHAERGAIYAAARHGIPTVSLTMYCCWAACTECARAIILSGVSHLVTHVTPQQMAHASWKESITVADRMLEEADVLVTRIADKIGGVKIRFNGEIIEP